MNTNKTPSEIDPLKIAPLELANLSAVLLLAQVIEVPQSGLYANAKREERMLATAAAALDYLKVCTNAIAQQSCVDKDAAAEAERKSQRVSTEKFIDAYKGAGVVPVSKIVTHCNAQNITLSPDELRQIGEKRKWSTMSSEAKKECVFLALTSKGRYRDLSSLGRVPFGYHRATIRESRPALSLSDGRKFIKSGVPIMLRESEKGLSAAGAIELIFMAKSERAAEKGREGAAKKMKKSFG